LGIPNADSAENGDPKAVHVVTPLSCASPHRGTLDPKMVGLNGLRVLPGTRLAGYMGAGEHHEGFFCNYGVGAEFRQQFERSGLRISALGTDGEIRGVESERHPFFIATLFQPQLTSVATGKPHPLLVAYLRAVAEHSKVHDARLAAER
jgi:CTP synthase (UTP-ammonia lyase)